jgi:hypothetical protein
MDEREFGGKAAAGDSDFEARVRHFMALNTSLKQIGTKAKEMMSTIKSQGQVCASTRYCNTSQTWQFLHLWIRFS